MASTEGDEEGGGSNHAATSALLSRLKADIIKAAQLDTLYSPQSDIVRHVNGVYRHSYPKEMVHL